MAKIVDIRSQTPKRSSTRSLSAVTHIARHHSGTTLGDFWTFWNGRWKSLGWITGGYHEIILRDGTVQLCYDPNMVTNGVGNHNSYTYHICLVGNGSFTEAQERAWEERALYNMKRLNIPVNRVLGHREFPGQSTACPGVDMNVVRKRLQQLLQPKKEEAKVAKVKLTDSQRRDVETAIKELTEAGLLHYPHNPDYWWREIEEGRLHWSTLVRDNWLRRRIGS